jgi:hypothetical protein
MSRDTYRKALKAAERELLKLIRLQEDTTRKIAQTRQTVLTLRTKLIPDDSQRNNRNSYLPKTLTDACRSVILATKTPVDAHDVRDRVEASGFEIKAKNKLASVYSVIRRLLQQREIVSVFRMVPNTTRPLVWSESYWINHETFPPPKGWKIFSEEEVKHEYALIKAIGKMSESDLEENSK